MISLKCSETVFIHTQVHCGVLPKGAVYIAGETGGYKAK